MANQKIVNIDNRQFDCVNAIEIKKLNSKYFVGIYPDTKQTDVLKFIEDNGSYIIDVSKRSDEEQNLLVAYFKSADGGKMFKDAINSGEIVSCFYDLPDVINASRKVVSKKNTAPKVTNLEPIVIDPKETKNSVVNASKVDRYKQLENVAKLVNNLQNEINSYYGVVNNDVKSAVSK